MSNSYFDKVNKYSDGYYKEKKNDQKKKFHIKDESKMTKEKKIEINSIYNNAKVYRIEKYGLFVNFDNNYSGLIHISKMENVPINYFQLDQNISVKIFEIINNKINLQLILDDEMKKMVSNNEKSRFDNNNIKHKLVSHSEEKKSYNDLFPSLNPIKQDNSKLEPINSSNVSSYSTSPWNNKLDKVKESPISNKASKNSSIVTCSYSNIRLHKDKTIKCQEDTNQEIYYFKSIYYACKYNNKFDKKLKIIKSDGKLEFLPDCIYLKKNSIDTFNSEIYNRDENLDYTYYTNEETSNTNKYNGDCFEDDCYEEEYEDFSDNSEEY